MAFTEQDRIYMAECISLARRGAGRVSPNPMVGCVVVRAGIVLARGWHRQYGGPHAEAHALARATTPVIGSTLYVNLEPCNHSGKTPPCTNAIIAAGIARVVIGARDPNPRVKGGGIRRLRDAGIEVVTGVLESESIDLNKFFWRHTQSGFPYVTLKLAQSLDGNIAARKGKQTWISGLESQRYVHRLRSEYDCVLIGSGTMNADSPRLTVRHVRGRNPLRVIIDTHLSASYQSLFFKDKALTMVFTSATAMNGKRARTLLSKGVVLVATPVRNGRVDLNNVFIELGQRGIISVLVEGGREIATDLLAHRLVDELQLIIAPKFIGAGIDAFGPQVVRAAVPVAMRAEPLGRDILITARFDTADHENS